MIVSTKTPYITEGFASSLMIRNGCDLCTHEQLRSSVTIVSKLHVHCKRLLFSKVSDIQCLLAWILSIAHGTL